MVLLEGHRGGDAAGKVIQAFGEVVVGGNYVVGLVVFVVLVLINFVVITKGAGRISEVTARFTLDAMPGKQMAIDADLNAGLIDQDQARLRRDEVSQESDFYGAMDGASKFVRGDAVAGILILIINIVGGLAIGMAQHDLSFSMAIENYTLLTIGDGLVAQIPSLLLSTAAAIMVTRVSREQDVGQQVMHQMFAEPRSLAVAAGVLGVLGLVPGMPHVVFLSLAAVAGFGAVRISVQGRESAPEEEGRRAARAGTRAGCAHRMGRRGAGRRAGSRGRLQAHPSGRYVARWDPVEPHSRRSKKISQELGFLVPSVHIRDNLDIPPNNYRLILMGVNVAEATIYPDKLMAIDPGEVFGRVDGIEASDPAFGLDAVWIDEDRREQAQTLGYTVVDPSTVVATHLNQVMQDHAAELIGHDEVQQMLDRLRRPHRSWLSSWSPGRYRYRCCCGCFRNCFGSGFRFAISAASPRRSSLRHPPATIQRC